jgi:hypothetical protein
VTIVAKIDALIREAEQWRVYHKQRGALGYIEALGCDIRIKALKDAKETIDASPSR